MFNTDNNLKTRLRTSFRFKAAQMLIELLRIAAEVQGTLGFRHDRVFYVGCRLEGEPSGYRLKTRS